MTTPYPTIDIDDEPVTGGSSGGSTASTPSAGATLSKVVTNPSAAFTSDEIRAAGGPWKNFTFRVTALNGTGASSPTDVRLADVVTDIRLTDQGALATSDTADFVTQVSGDGKPSKNAGTSITFYDYSGDFAVAGNGITKSRNPGYNVNVWTREYTINSGFVSGEFISAGTIMGLSNNGQTIDSYQSLEFALMADTDHKVKVYESGVQVYDTALANDGVWAIAYDGISVRYYKDGVQVYTSTKKIDSGWTMYAGLNANDIGNTIHNVQFGIMGDQALAQLALNSIGHIAADNIVSAGTEKRTLIDTYNTTVATANRLVQESLSFVSLYGDQTPTQRQAVVDAIATLNSYLNSLSPAWNSVPDTTQVDGATLSADFKGVLDASLALQTANNVVLRTHADWDGVRGDGKDALIQQAQTADLNALSALASIVIIQSDGYLSANEKPTVIRLFTDATNERDELIAQATALGVSTAVSGPIVAYTKAYSALGDYLTSLSPAWNDTTKDTVIVPATFNGKFSDYYYAKQTLINAMAQASYGATTGVNLTDGDGNILTSPDIVTSIGTSADSNKLGGVPATKYQTVVFDNLPPDIPSGLLLTSTFVVNPDGTTHSTLIAKWNASTADDLAGYVLAISTNGGGFVEFDNGNVTTFTTTLPAATSVSAKVSAYDRNQNRSGFSPVQSVTTAASTVPPSPPTNVAATTLGLGGLTVSWTNPNNADISTAIVYESATNDFSKAAVVATVNSVANGVGSATLTRYSGFSAYYWVVAVNTSGLLSTPSTSAKGTVATVSYTDLTPGLVAPVTVSSLPDPTGYLGPALVFNQADGKLYRYVNGAFTSAVSTTDLTGTLTSGQIGPGTIAANNLDSGIKLIRVLTALTDAGVENDVAVFQGKLYRYTNGAWTATTASSDITGTLASAQIADGSILASKLAANSVTQAALAGKIVSAANLVDAAVGAVALADDAVTNAKLAGSSIDASKFALNVRPIETFTALPAAGTPGRVVYNSSDGKLYRDTGSSWTTAVASEDISGRLAATQIESLAATQITGALSDSQIAQVAAAKLIGTIGSSQIASGAITDDKIGSVTAAKVTGALTDAQIASVAAAKISGQLTSDQIAAISAIKISGALSSDQIASVAAAKVSGTLVSSQISSVASETIVGAITSDQIGSLAAAKLSGQITTTQITDNAISTGKIAAGAITSAQIAAQTITAGNLLIGDTTNYANNPDFSAGDVGYNIEVVSGTPGYIRNVSGTAMAFRGSPYLAYVSGGYSGFRNTALMNVAPGDKLLGFAYLNLTGVVNGSYAVVRISYTDHANKEIFVEQASHITQGTADESGTAHTRTVVAGTVPANAAYARVEVFGAAYGCELFIGMMGLMRRATGELIVDGAITADKVAANTITAGQIAANTITAAQIAAGSITTTELAAYTITAGNIAAQTITGDRLVAGTITAAQIAAQTITASQISSYTITAAQIAGGTITADQIAANTLSANKLVASTRPVSAIGFNFRIGADGILRWDDGVVHLLGDDTALQFHTVYGGGVSWQGAPLYFVKYNRAYNTNFDIVQDANIFNNASYTPIGIWETPTQFTAVAGTGTEINGDRIVTGTINADRIIANSITSTQIAANAITASQILAGAVTADKVAANTISAKQLVVATRPVSVAGLNLRVDTDGALRWDAANVVTVGDDGNPVVYAVSAGSLPPGQPNYLLYIPPHTYLDYNPDPVYAGAVAGAVPIAYWNGYTDITNIAGVSTVLNGDRIVTGTINANKIVANSITAGQIAAGTITGTQIQANSISGDRIVAGSIAAAQIAAGAITADKLLVGSLTTLNPDPGFRDTTFWANSGVYSGPLGTSAGSVPGWYNSHGSDINALLGTTQYCMLWDAYFKSTGRQHIISTVQYNIKGGKVYELSAYGFNGCNQPINAYLRLFGPDGVYLYDIGLQWLNGEGVVRKNLQFTTPSNVNAYQFIVFNDSGTMYAGHAEVSALQVTEAFSATTIMDGAITTAKLTAQAVTADKIAANTITSNQIQARSIVAQSLVAGTITGTEIAAQTISASNIAAGTITANEIAANAVTANKLVAASRPVSAAELNVRYIAGTLYWDAGNIVTVADSGATIYYSVPGGSASGEGYLVYQVGSQALSYINDYHLVGNPAYITICYYNGASLLNLVAGVSTTLNGGNIVTGTINADRIIAGSITSTQMAANSISANVLSIGTKPMFTTGLNMRVEADGNLYFDAGRIHLSTDTGLNYYDVPGSGPIPYTGQPYYFVYYVGRPVIDYTTDAYYARTKDFVQIAVWKGGSDLTVFSGVGTSINGDRITTGTINANRIVASTITSTQIAANTITGNNLVAGTITAAQIAAGAITASALTIGSTDNIIPDGNYRDPNWWNGTTSGGAVYPVTLFDTSSAWTRFSRAMRVTGTFDFLTPFFQVEPGATYRITVQTYIGNVQSGTWFNPVMHIPGIEWYSLRTGGSITGGDPTHQTSESWTTTNYSGGTVDLRTLTLLNDSAWNVNHMQFRFCGNVIGDNVEIGISIVRVSDNTLIADNSITTGKIVAGAVTANSIAAGSITGDRISTTTSLPGTITVGNTGVAIATTAAQAANSANLTLVDPLTDSSNDNQYAIRGNSITKIQPNGFYANVYSRETYTGSATVSARFIGDGGFIGISDNSAAPNSSDFQYISYAWHRSVNHDFGYGIFINGNGISFGMSRNGLTFSNNTTFKIVYDGVAAKFYADSVLMWTDGTSANRSFRAAFAIDPIGVAITGIAFSSGMDNSLSNADPATRINNYSTQIDPGRVVISGGTSLADWRNGGDNTKIEGGSIAANTISANKLTIGNRALTFQDLNFQANPATNTVTWGGGGVSWTDDNGNSQFTAISGGSAVFSGSYIHLYWTKGSGSISATTNNYIVSDPNSVVVALYEGGSMLIVNYGGTIIDGSRITTGSITADRLSVTSLSAISATIGLFKSAPSGQRTEIDNYGVRGYYDNGNMSFRLGNW